MTKFSDKYNKAIQLIDEAYKSDKDQFELNNKIYPKEYLYALRMVEELELFNSDASEEVYIAARCQHLFRWEIPRNSYPMDRKGYHAWRTFLYTYQAKKSVAILNEIGYSEASQLKIASMIEKKNLQSDSNSQLLEDVVCLVFLKYYINDFVEQHKENTDKLKRIILSTWLKMSDEGHKAALTIPFKDAIKTMILEAVS